MSTSSYPARIPASTFTNPTRRRKSSLKNYTTLPPLKTRVSNVDDVYIPRTPTFMSIAYLREALSSIDIKMAALVKERTELESKLETAVRLQSPVLRLPSELLSSIFTIGVLGMGDEDPVMVPTLMLVCRYWADVALNTPVLWAKISVSPHNSLEKARRRLMRSKSCPLDITVNFGPRNEYIQNVNEQIMHAMDLFRPAMWRTRSFSLTVPNRPHAYTALLRCQEDAPILESLTIQVYHSIDDHCSNPRFSLFNGCTPKLRSCSLTSFNFGWDLKLMTGLRVLKLGGYFNSFTPSVAIMLDALRQCPELEELNLRNMSNVDSHPCSPARIDDYDMPVTNKIHLPRLKKMSFYYSGIFFTREIMSHISFPALETLDLGYLEDATSLVQLVYAQALTRLPLKHLRIETCNFNEMKFVNLLRKLPSLVTLEFVEVEDISNVFFKALSLPQPWTCPHLEYVTLDGCTSFAWDSLRSFIESRLPADPHAYKRYHHSTAPKMSSASAAAADYVRMKSLQERNPHGALLAAPQRIQMIDVTRCNQISQEMIQWLRMYVASVKCESAKGVWGQSTMP
ncbi:hypothetical protein JR316_0006927 [Psilocybe cubensis]|uniref:F-box domain-containing protein n=2 Tax=Psilocybe cubensis TaxID=181762 RepID=A0A8H8CME2_PSICU|nr:hypothetical protein JR316_0006927 [Psilocybe cubensis]KAH9480329.1 hypothetical protein JR316_0006927 [Psilocybe cubensis]